MKRGEVWWVELGSSKGGEIQKGSHCDCYIRHVGRSTSCLPAGNIVHDESHTDSTEPSGPHSSLSPFSYFSLVTICVSAHSKTGCAPFHFRHDIQSIPAARTNGCIQRLVNICEELPNRTIKLSRKSSLRPSNAASRSAGNRKDG